MVLVMKVRMTVTIERIVQEVSLTEVMDQLSAFCWNVHDGRLPQDSISDFQRERAIRQLPSPFDFAGYVVRRI